MVKIKYDARVIKYMSMFEAMTGVKLKDCFIDDNDIITFVVDDIYVGKAMGRRKQNLQNLEKIIKKKMKILGFSEDIKKFIKNIVYPLNIKDVKMEENVVKIFPPDARTKSILIGRNSKNLNNLKNILKRYFDITDVRVV